MVLKYNYQISSHPTNPRAENLQNFTTSINLGDKEALRKSTHIPLRIVTKKTNQIWKNRAKTLIEIKGEEIN